MGGKKQRKAEKKLDLEEEKRNARKVEEQPPPKIPCQMPDCTVEFTYLNGYYQHLSDFHKGQCSVCGSEKCFKVFRTKHEADDHAKVTGHAQAKSPEEMLKQRRKHKRR